jgi:PTH1 family peptidyl-tRNA hydrolase
MNLSGQAVRALFRAKRCDSESLIVVHDDLDLALGRIKFKARGGDGGHKGIRSIVEALGEDRFLRLRIGIGRPPAGMDATEFVLESFGEDERRVMETTLQLAVDGLETLVLKGLGEAVRLCHSPSEPQAREAKEKIE